MYLSLDPIVHFFSRNIYHNIESRFFCHEAKGLNKEIKDKQKFRLKNMNFYNGYTIKPRLLTTRVKFNAASEEG